MSQLLISPERRAELLSCEQRLPGLEEQLVALQQRVSELESYEPDALNWRAATEATAETERREQHERDVLAAQEQPAE